MTPFEWTVLGMVGLVFVLRNWWDIIRYGLDLDRRHPLHHDPELPLPH